MIYSIDITNHRKETITLELKNPWTDGIYVKSIEGIGPEKATINTSELALVDGALYNSSRLGTRNIVLNLGFLDLGTPNIEAIRHKSYRFFPVKRKVTLTFHTDERNSSIDGYVESNEPDIFSKDEGTKISILCPDPYFYEVDGNGDRILTNGSFYGETPLFEFEFENDSLEEPLLEFGEVTFNKTQIINYDGDADAGCIMSIFATGQIEYITIYNMFTGGRMIIDTDKIEDVTGSGVNRLDKIVISTVRGNKYAQLIRNDEIWNILNCINADADWFQIAKGENPFAFSADIGAQNLKCDIQSYIMYDGV